MESPLSINDILIMEASANMILKKCQLARLQLQPVSTGGSKKIKGLSAEKSAKLIAGRRARLLKRSIK